MRDPHDNFDMIDRTFFNHCADYLANTLFGVRIRSRAHSGGSINIALRRSEAASKGRTLPLAQGGTDYILV